MCFVDPPNPILGILGPGESSSQTGPVEYGQKLVIAYVVYIRKVSQSANETTLPQMGNSVIDPNNDVSHFVPGQLIILKRGSFPNSPVA